MLMSHDLPPINRTSQSSSVPKVSLKSLKSVKNIKEGFSQEDVLIG